MDHAVATPTSPTEEVKAIDAHRHHLLTEDYILVYQALDEPGQMEIARLRPSQKDGLKTCGVAELEEPFSIDH